MLLEQIFQNPIVFTILIIWSTVWKGFSLWRASQHNSKPWFVLLLVVNTAGILDILYIFIFSKMQKKTQSIGL